jgi:hypothetical protein
MDDDDPPAPVIIKAETDIAAPEAVKFFRWLGFALVRGLSWIVAYRALTMFLPKEEFEAEWRPLHDEARDLSHTRNILAHHPTKRIGTSRKGMAFDIYSIHIEPYERILNDDYSGLRGKTELRIKDLRQHDTEVTVLESKLHNFAWRVGGKRAGQV